MLATITAAPMMFYAAATAQAEDMVRRIHDATIALVSLDRQMIGRLAYVVVPDFMYLEYRALYLELRPFRDFHGRVPPIVRAPVASGAAVTVDDLQRAVEEVKRTVRKAKREIIEDAHTARARGGQSARAHGRAQQPDRRRAQARARGARQRQENVDSPRVPRGVAGRQRRLSVTRGALRLLPQPQDRVLDHAVREDGKAAGCDFVS